MAYIHEWLVAFALTQVVEMGVYQRAVQGGRGKRLWVAFSASAITHPAVWFIFPQVVGSLPLGGLEVSHYSAYFVVAESFAVFTECLHLRAFGCKRPLTYSLAANAASVMVGYFCYFFLGF